MIPTISFPQIKQLLFFLLLLKAHAQPPFASINHHIQNELQHYQHHQHQHHQKQEKLLSPQKHLLDLLDLTLIDEHSNELKTRAGKNSSLPLITFNIQNLKYPLGDEKFNSKGFNVLSINKENNNNIGIPNDQYKINQSTQIYYNQPSSSSSSSSTKSTTTSENVVTPAKAVKQVKQSHQHKREVILADIPLWSLQFAAIPSNDTRRFKNEIPLLPSSSSQSALDYTYNNKPAEDSVVTTDGNFASTEISENEINKMFSPNEFSYFKEIQKQKRRPPSSSSQRFSKSSSKGISNKIFLEPLEYENDRGGDEDSNDNIEHKKIKFYQKSYPFQNERLKVKNRIRSNPYNNGDDSEDYDGDNNYDVGNSKNNNKNNNNNYNNKYYNNLNDDNIENFQDIFNDKRLTAPPVWMKMLRNRKDGRKPWALVDRKQEMGGGNIGSSSGNRIQYYNEPDSKSHGMLGFKRQKLKTHQTQFVPSISVGAMTNLGDFFDKLRNNVDFMEKGNFDPDTIDIMEGDHLNKISEHIKSDVIDGGQTGKPTGTAAFLHAIRTYRPSQKVRALVSMTPEGYHGHGTHFSDPNYMWMGLGK